MNPEKALIEAFILSPKRRRFLELLDIKGGRAKLRSYLPHLKGLDPRFCQRIPPPQQRPAEILRLLKSFGAPPICRVIGNSDLDGLEVLLSDALEEVFGQGYGTFLSCIPGELAYFEGEEMHARYICRRERNT